MKYLSASSRDGHWQHMASFVHGASLNLSWAK